MYFRYLINVTVIVWCAFSSLNAQNDIGKPDDLGRIALNPYVPEQSENVPFASKGNLENKLAQIATHYGMGSSALLPQFIISANLVILSKDFTPTAPPMMALTVEITLYIGDGIEGRLFASTSLNAKGVGENETKAYNSVLKNLNPDNATIKKFVQDGKSKIIAYYNSRCEFILKEAKMLESQNRFDEAIYKLMSVPDVCQDCYNKAMDEIGPIFQNKINWECKSRLSEARNVWSTGLNYQAANSAAEILSTIDPESSCFKEATALTGEISRRIKEIDGREWNFMLKTEIDLERDRIKAYRDIGVAWGNNQPQNIVYKSLW